jgi:hypothetical protein
MTDATPSPAVDRRRVVAMRWLGGTALAMIGLAAVALGVIGWGHWGPNADRARITALTHLGALALTVLMMHVTAWAFVLGPMEWRFRAGRFEVSAEGGGDCLPPRSSDAI